MLIFSIFWLLLWFCLLLIFIKSTKNKHRQYHPFKFPLNYRYFYYGFDVSLDSLQASRYIKTVFYLKL